MSQSANVTSIEALKRFRVAIQQYEQDTRAAITELVLEMRRAIEWIEIDRARYWPHQWRVASEAVTEARVSLERKQLTADSSDSPSCYEEKKALHQARQRMRLAEDKIRIVQRWQVNCKQESDELQGQLAKLGGLLEANLPRAIAALEQMIQSLDAYAQPGSLVDPMAPSSASPSHHANSTRDRSKEDQEP
jgi:hypothetical protein